MSPRTFVRTARLALRTESAALNWYRERRSWIAGIASRSGKSARAVAGVVAALSPMVPWDHQEATTERWIRSGGRTSHAGLRANKAKARRILRGETPETVLGGPKVRAFFRALAGDDHAVVVDRHVAAMFGEPEKFGVRAHRRMVAWVRAYAARVGASPCALQAAAWVAWRKLSDATPF